MHTHDLKPNNSLNTPSDNRLDNRPNTSNFEALFLANTPMLDVRAPIEYEKGAFPNTCNSPILTNEERHQVGITYKTSGQDEAIALANSLVYDSIKQQRVNEWLNFAHNNPDGYLYCFRGGLRSRTAQSFLKEAGVNYPLVTGGYKAMRRFLLDQLDLRLADPEMVVVSGCTGSGKTRVIHATDRSLDLEGIANHRGSSFGRTLQPQPSQIDFENQISIDLLRLTAGDDKLFYVEDESRLIGRCFLPQLLQDRLKVAPYVIVAEPIESRIEIVTEEYVLQPLEEYQKHYGDEGFTKLKQDLLDSLDRIKKRLGGSRHAELYASMVAAFQQLEDTDDYSLLGEWIEALLTDYYDPMYNYMLDKKSGKLLFKGTRQEVIQWINK